MLSDTPYITELRGSGSASATELQFRTDPGRIGDPEFAGEALAKSRHERQAGCRVAGPAGRWCVWR